MPAVPRLDQVVDFARHRALRALGTEGAPGSPARAALRRAGGARGRRIASYARMLQELDQGRQVTLEELLPAVTLQLDAADAALARGRHRAAAQLVDRALRLAFHPSAHYGRLGSPLMLQAERFLAPLRSSAAARAMLFDADPEPSRGARVNHSDERPRRVLVLCHSSWTFVERVIADLGAHTEVEFRTVDLSALPIAERPTHALAVQMRSTWNRAHHLQPVPASLDEDFHWADTIFIEWGTYPFAWFSFLDLSAYGARTVARIHRFETLTPYPLLARSAAYDEIGFVSPPLSNFLATVSPRLHQAGGTRVLQNTLDLTRFVPAPGKETFELVQIGWATPIKDVAFSLEVLRRLRAVDARYVLVLVGPTLEHSATPRTAAWAQEVQTQIDELGDAVRVLGYRTDVPDILGTTGFLLSSSGNEGTHESVAEAAAAGCVPVVRNWPEIAPWGGAGMIYPEAWIVSDIDSAVSRVRSLAEPGAYADEAQRCRSWILEHRDPAAIRSEYLEFLGDDRRPGIA